MSDDVASALDTASEITKMVGAVPGPIGIIARIASLALKAGSAFAKAGKDPVKAIERILSADPEVAAVHAGWNDYAAELFGQPAPSTPPTGRRKTDPPPPSESAPSSISKRKTDPASDEDDPYEGD